MSNPAKIEVEDKVLTFGKYDAEEVEIGDDGLVRYINLENILSPRSKGRHTERQFYKAEVPITERLLTHMYVAGHRGNKHYITSGKNTGKSEKLWNIIEEVFDNIYEQTDENPIQVLVDAIENSAPVEEVVTYQRGGARARKAVIMAPQRRVDVALRLLVQGAYEKRLAESEDAVETLTNELIGAADGNNEIRAVRTKERKEREAEGAR
ncbi:30S ribosomal protein S7 [Candidatus Nanohalobium constans]|uniref:30S ribosomal protein S7 n=1 Tax=Candidatus Nanohalobium constans TaxID=2565781 RepID=A0A5Q0UHV9_9ARCH|nr:30S ribosomal protein S7 [Candidatus Nanohalobium constans]QGA80780.1 30S ribosomal protein S7 [Candidatus Nanohalobium constans]